MRPAVLKTACMLLCAAVLSGCVQRSVGGIEASSETGSITAGSMPAPEERLPTLAEVEDEYQYITAEIDFGLPKGLAFLHPAGDVTVTGERYYLTGTSDPDQPLLLDGEPVEDRGAKGSFARFVSLQAGDNAFTLEQGETQKTVTIRRGSPEESVPTTDKITKMEPAEDLGLKGERFFTLRCVAPAGSKVSARINGQTVALEQGAVAQPGVPANFSAQYPLPAAEGIQELGQVAYLLDGKEYLSEGSLFTIAPDSKLVVQIKNVSSSVFSAPSVNSEVMTTGKKGAVDEVVDFGGDAASGEMYRLRMGGWIQTAAASPLAGSAQTDNRVSKVVFSQEDRRETYTFSGTTRPFYRAALTEDALTIRFYHTEGIGKIDGESVLFDSVEAVQEESDSVVTFRLKEPEAFWGYLVEYRDKDTVVTCLQKPAAGKGNLPLEGVTVAVDAGHGGSDTGTLGLPYEGSPMEKDVTIAAAEALQKKLGLLGARVVMARTGDENPTMNARMELAREHWADFYISLHANSAGYSPELISVTGLEVYYFEPNHEKFAQMAADKICASTGRKNRGARQSNYRVTMQSFAPSILVEMGFMPNPSDFDSLCDPDEIYRTVTAIADTLVESLSSGGNADTAA